jgi:hypothetical protein
MKADGKVWICRFYYVSPSSSAKGYAFHGPDVPLIFNAAMIPDDGLSSLADQRPA